MIFEDVFLCFYVTFAAILLIDKGALDPLEKSRFYL